jgi:dephospho-CoA kinase
VIGQLKLVGLTGGIGSGKSTVGRMVQDLGVPVIDADQLARQVVEPGQPAHAEIAATWPQVIVAQGPQAGQLDRKRLAALVFADPPSRLRLEAITHPRIQQRLLEEAERLARAGHRLAFYEASLLVEVGRHRDFDALVVVDIGEEQQLGRVMAREATHRDQVLERIRAQLPLADKRRVATHIIDNSGDLANTRRQVEALVHQLRGP